MKKVLIGLSVIIVLVITFNYCSSTDYEEPEKVSIKVKPEKSKVSGSLEGYLEVVKSEYNLSEEFGMSTIVIKIKGIKAMTEEQIGNKLFSLGLNILTKEGIPLSDLDELESDPEEESAKIKTLLLKGRGEAFIELVGFGKPTEKASKFSLTSKSKTEESDDESSETASSDDDSEGSVNYDKMLDDYDKYVTQYIAIAKKMKKGDQSAMVEYPKFMEKTQKLGETLEKVQNDDNFSPEQMGRMSKIQMRMLEAMK